MSDDTKKIIAKEEQLANYDGDDKIITSHQMMTHLEAFNRKTQEIKFGFPQLDTAVGGIESGEVIVISGVTGNGKTLLAQSMTNNLISQNIAPVWFSFEVQPRHFLNKFGAKPPVFLMPKRLKGNSIKWLAERIWEAKLKFNIKVVFIDHLHFIVNMSSRQNMSLEIGSVMRQLKTLAIEHNIAIVLISHTAKVNIERDRKEGLELSDIRDSSFISQEADTVLMIWRTTDVSNGALLKIVKDRKKGTFNKVIGLAKHGHYLKEISDV